MNTVSKILVLAVGLGLPALPASAGDSETAGNPRLAEQVNLALRRTAHLLLKASGDSTSRIAPIQQTGKLTWQVKMERAFNYDLLPPLLHQSFELHRINYGYDVAVLDCREKELQLGYNYVDFVQTETVPCGGRDIETGCYYLQVTLSDLPVRRTSDAFWLWLAGGTLLGGIAYWFLKRRKTPEVAKSPVELTGQPAAQISLGQTSFLPAEQLLVTGAVRHTLTYREAKLLQLFVNHPNQLLQRDLIMQQVWQDEGVIVGRSLDVFVSRLRKMLRDDPSLQLVAVHGVGYRLEIVENN